MNRLHSIWSRLAGPIIALGLIVLAAAPGSALPSSVAVAAPGDRQYTFLPVINRGYTNRFTGAFIPLVSATTWNNEVNDFVALTAKPQALYLTSAGFGCPWVDNVEDIKPYLDHIYALGATALITWMPMDCSHGGFGDVTTISLQDIIDGTWDAYIAQWADEISGLGYKVFVRWGHEMNIPSYSWAGQYAFGTNGKTAYASASEGCGLKGCFGDPQVYDGPERYIAAYRHVHNLAAAHAPNIVWVWNPNARNWPMPDVAPWNQYHNYYPGNEYVDWVALDGYNWGDYSGNGYGEWLNFDGMFGNELNDLAHSYPGKFQMIAEFGSVEDEHDPNRKPNFIRDAYQAAKKYPRLMAIIWVQDNTFNDAFRRPPYAPGPVDFRVNSSAASLQAYRDSVASWSSAGLLP